MPLHETQQNCPSWNNGCSCMYTEVIADIGNEVICDICSDDHTKVDEPGGILFGSKGIC